MRFDWTSLALALVLTLSNATKDLVVDDTPYVAVAAQIARHPLDPFGMALALGARPLPAHQLLLTPVVPYFLAPAVRLFPAQPAVWKLWLFPFALLFVLGARALAARLAPGLDATLTSLFILSPAVLPAFNLMLDLPALALAWFSLAVFLTARDRRSVRLALVAGLLAGLAAQTKYPGGTALAVMVVSAVQRRFWRGAAVAVASGAAVFAAWELFVLRSYGHTMLFQAAGERAGMLTTSPAALLLGTLCLLGALAPGVTLLGLARWRGAAVSAALVQAAAFLILLFAPSWPPTSLAALLPGPLEPAVLAYLPAAVAMSVALLVAVRRMAWGDEVDRLLLAWGAIELAATLVMTPFLASRRLMGLAGVATLLVGRAALRGVSHRQAAWCAAWSAVMGCLVFGIDWTAARETRLAVERTSSRLEELGRDASRQQVWFSGHWSFEYYADRAGWRAVEPGDRLRPGDWLIEPDHISRQPVRLFPSHWPVVEPRYVERQAAHLERRLLRVRASLDDPPRLRLTTIPFYYLGGVPVGSRRSAQVPLTIKQVLRGAVARGLRR